MVKVRRATAEDAESIIHVTKQAFERYVTLAKIEDTPALHEEKEDVLKDIQEKLVYVAYVDHQIVGSVRVELLENQTAYFSRFGVCHGFQNLGIGKEIMTAVDTDMESKKVERLLLHTASKAFSLVRFYYERGFYVQSISTEKGYLRALMCKEYPV